MTTDKALPFVCPSCGTRFGLGPDAVLLSVVSNVPISGEPTPCCGARIWGSMEREALVLTIDEWRAGA